MEELEMFRLIAPEFSEVSDAEVLKYCDLCKPMISSKVFGKLYAHALAYLTAHKMKLAGFGHNDAGTVAETFRLSSYSEGGVSVSFGSNPQLDVNGEYALTVYGQQYLAIKRSVIVPIHCSGEGGTNFG